MELTNNVKKILNSFDYEIPGVLSNLARILMAGKAANSGKLFIYNTEDLLSYGAVNCIHDDDEKYSPIYHFSIAQTIGISAICGTLGFLEAGAFKFAGEIPLILKINSLNSLNEGKLDPTCAVTANVKDALRLGCSGIAFTIHPGSDRSDEMFEDFAEVAREAKSYGLPVMAIMNPKGGSLTKDAGSALDVLAYSAHLASHLGAHIIVLNFPKAVTELAQTRRFYNNFNVNDDGLRTRHILNNAFGGRKIVCFSEGKDNEPEDLFLAARNIYKVGGNGLVLSKTLFEKEVDQAGEFLTSLYDEMSPNQG